MPELFGGSADLSESNLTLVKDGGDFGPVEAGRNLWFGVREHAMGGAVNGIAYHGGFIPYAATFLNFSDYMRGSVRLAALAGLHVIYVWTHDSVGLGEDGPTHQPIEHYAALRAMPNLWFVRPGDANEATAAWRIAVERDGGPVALALTRQKLPTLAGTAELAREGVARGGYVLRRARGEQAGKAPELLLIATGSELQLAFAAAEALEQDSIEARVVSLPCWEAFERQDEAYRDSVIPPSVRRRVTIEIGSATGWERYAGDEGAIIGIDHFGASAPAGTIFEKLGFTTERVVDVARRVVREGLHGRIPTLDPGHQPAGLGLGHGPTAAAIGRPSDVVRRRVGRRSNVVVRSGPLLMGGLRVGFAADHAGAALKAELLRRVAAARPDDTSSTSVATAPIRTTTTRTSPSASRSRFVSGEVERGILICGSGVGASIAANKVRGVRAAVCHDTYSAHQGVEHDDMNVLTLGSRVIGPEVALECSLAFLAATFSGEPRHRRRLDKVLAIEAAEST